jgi:foldase protein PrsA
MRPYGACAAALALSLVATAGAAPAKINPANDVVAMVNDEPITREMLVKRVLSYYGDQTLEAMINQAIVRQAAAKNKLTVTDAEVTSRVSEIQGMFRTPELYHQMLRDSGMTPPQHREQVRFTILSEKVVSKIDPVKDSELETVRARIIVVNTEEEARQLVKSLKAGGDFIQTARLKSQDKRTAQMGGDLGYFMKLDATDIWQAVAPLKAGEIAGPVKVANAFAIVKLEDRRPASKLTAVEKDRYKTRVLSYKINEWLERSRRQAKVTRPVPVNLP